MPHITFIHGISNKPAENKLKQIWLDALTNDLLNNGDGLDLGAMGVTTSMIYWADVLYAKPEEILKEAVANLESTEEVAGKSEADPDMSWRETITDEEKKMVDSLAAKLSLIY